jgi:hypothetical protein
MDEQGVYPIKVLDMAPLIMVTLPTVSSFFSTCGCFLRDSQSSSGDLPSLSLACGWPLGANGSLFLEWWHLQRLRVQDPSGARKRGAEPTSGVGQAGRLGPTSPGPSRPARSPDRASWVLRWLCTLPPPFSWFWRCHPHIQDRGSSCMKFGLLRINPRGCSFVALQPCHHWKWFHQAHEHEQDSVNAPLNLLWIRPLCSCFSA